MEHQRLSEPIKLHEEVTKCPACGKNTLHVQVFMYQVPLVGHVMMTVGKCSNCGFSFRDVRTAEQRPPQRLRLRVTKPEHLNILVVRAPSATIRIRGLSEKGDFEMKPGPVADGFITTVEGILHRFLEVTEFACNEPDADKKLCSELLTVLREAIEGKRSFELIIEDPEGVSAIASREVVREPLETGKMEKHEPGEKRS